MNDKDRAERAESLLRLLDGNDGRLFINEIQNEMDTTVKKLIFAEGNEIFAVQGRAQAYYDILKKFEDAKKTLNR